MSERAGRPKVLDEDMERVGTTIPWQDDAALNALVASTGISKTALLRLFISTGIQAFTDTLVGSPSVTPSSRKPR